MFPNGNFTKNSNLQSIVENITCIIAKKSYHFCRKMSHLQQISHNLVKKKASK